MCAASHYSSNEGSVGQHASSGVYQFAVMFSVIPSTEPVLFEVFASNSSRSAEFSSFS